MDWGGGGRLPWRAGWPAAAVGRTACSGVGRWPGGTGGEPCGGSAGTLWCVRQALSLRSFSCQIGGGRGGGGGGGGEGGGEIIKNICAIMHLSMPYKTPPPPRGEVWIRWGFDT